MSKGCFYSFALLKVMFLKIMFGLTKGPFSRVWDQFFLGILSQSKIIMIMFLCSLLFSCCFLCLCFQCKVLIVYALLVVNQQRNHFVAL